MWQGNYSKLFIGGDWVDPATNETITVVSPLTEEPIATVPSGSAADMDRAVTAARNAFDTGPWPRMSVEERSATLRRLSERLAEHEDDMASLVTAEMGCPITQSHLIQAQRPRAILDSAIEQAACYPWEELRESSTGRARLVRDPVGVVAAIVPWNAPHLITMMKLAHGLLAGCTFVLKPAPETPLDAYLFADLLDRAGLPAGVVNVVPADREASEHLVRHPGVDKVSFTGSTTAGRRIGAICGEAIRRFTLELGGKSAAIVLDDADLDAVIANLRTAAFMNTGQVCSSKTRVVVSRNRAQELTEGLQSLLGTLPVGAPTDPDTFFGPLASQAHRQRVEGYIQIGQDEGATLVAGGGRPAGFERGWFVEPTIFTNVEPTMRIAQEEIFGPVVSIIAFEDEDEAVDIANNSEYGLNGQVHTTDPAHGLALARRIRTGTVEINGSPIGLWAPQGGFKSSGIGRELGPEGFASFLEIKTIGLPATL
jgi:aldehyde dehydrogenase (NAD+)